VFFGCWLALITEKLAEIYTKAEDKYFDALDFLDAKGLPVYAYSDFFENKGVPSFVVTIAIIVAILILLTVILTYKGGDFRIKRFTKRLWRKSISWSSVDY